MRKESNEKLRPHTTEMFQTSSTINDMYGDDDRDLAKDKTLILAGIGAQLSKKQVKGSKGSRSRMEMVESHTSNTSSLN